jgi:tetratricopeptide (TPR) repeat protein
LPEEKRVVLRSGDIKRHVMSEAAFRRSWERADYWGMVVLPTDQLPVGVDEDRYLRTVAALESTGRYETAAQAYQTALERWPANSFALLGLGNTRYALGDISGAESAYRQLLLLDPDHLIALNNLAETLAYRGCIGKAAETIDVAIDASDVTDPLFASLIATRDQIAAMSETACQAPN